MLSNSIQIRRSNVVRWVVRTRNIQPKYFSVDTQLYNHVSEIRTASSYYNPLHAKPYLGLGRYTPACVFFSLQRHRGLVQEQFLALNASGYS